MNVYVSDTHLGHANIIKYCDRPFKSVGQMDAHIMAKLIEADALGHTIFHLGDFAMTARDHMESLPALEGAKRHTLIAGNHDALGGKGAERRKVYYRFFGTLIGHEKRWKKNTLLISDVVNGDEVTLLLSHLPQEDLQGADFNLYGHCHNSNVREPSRLERDYPWLVGSERHFNVGVELIDYTPRTMAELLEMRTRGAVLL